MSLVDQLRLPAEQEGRGEDDASSSDSLIAERAGSPDAPGLVGVGNLAWAVVPAGAVGLGAVALQTNLGRGALSGAVAAAAVGLFGLRVRQHSDAQPDASREGGTGQAGRHHWQSAPRLIGCGLAAGGVTGLGTLVTSGSSTAVGAVGQLILGWVTLALLFDMNADGESLSSTRARRVRLVDQAVLATAIVAIAAIATRSIERPAAEFMLAVPVGLALYFVSLAIWPSALSEPARAGRAITSGVLAATLAGIGVSTASVTVALLVVLFFGSIGALALVRLLLVRSASTEFGIGATAANRLLTAGGVLTLLSAGAGGVGALGLAGFSALVVLERQRRRPIVVQIRQLDTSERTARRVVTGLTGLAVTLRLLAFRGLWLDEATSAHQARLPFVQMLRLIYSQDNHPPLSQILLWVDVRVVGDSEFALRLPEVIIGSLLIPMLYITGKELFDRRAGLYAAAIGTVAPLAVWYGQEARMYAQFMLLALVIVYAQARILKGASARYWVLFTACCVALVYTQYFSVLHVGATMLVFLLAIAARRRRRNGPGIGALVKPLALSIGVQLLLYVPLIPFALHQAVHNQQTGNGFSASTLSAGSAVVPAPGIYGLLTNIQWAIWGYQPTQLTTRLVALWPIGLLILLLLLGQPRRNANRSLLIIAGLPVLTIFGASFIAAKSRSLAEVRYVAGAVPLLFLLLAAGVTTVVSSRRIQHVVIGGLLLSMVAALLMQETSTDNPRLYQYREAVRRVQEQALPGDQLIYAPHYMDYVLEYYSPGISVAPLEDGVPTKPTGKVFLLEAASFSDSDAAGSDMATAIQKLENEGMKLEARYNYAQVSVWELS